MSSGPTRGARAVAALIAMRIVYAVNWLNIGAVFFSMEPDFGTGVVGLGTLTSTFYLGLVLFQVPGGVIAAKWGPKKVVVLGTMLSSFSAFASGAAPSFELIAALRFLVGAGMAFVFAPAVVMVTRLIRVGGIGKGVGLFNSAYGIGGIPALFLWGILAEGVGWRLSLEFSGALGIASGLLVLVFTPADETNAESQVRVDQLWRVLGDRRLLLVGIGMLAGSVANGLISSFMNYYLIGSLGLSAAYAGLVASMVVVVPIFASLAAGRTYDRTRRPKMLLIVSNIAGVAAVAVCAYPSLAAALLGSVLEGLATGYCFTVGFAAARDYHTSGKDYDGLAVAWVNCINLFGVVIPPLVFSIVANVNGYPDAWLVGAALTALLSAPLVLLKGRASG